MLLGELLEYTLYVNVYIYDSDGTLIAMSDGRNNLDKRITNLQVVHLYAENNEIIVMTNCCASDLEAEGVELWKRF